MSKRKKVKRKKYGKIGAPKSAKRKAFLKKIRSKIKKTGGKRRKRKKRK